MESNDYFEHSEYFSYFILSKCMIYYLVTYAHKYTLSPYLLATGRDISPKLYKRVRILFYEDLTSLKYLPSGTYIFSDIERLSSAQTVQAHSVHAALKNNGMNVVNDPLNSMRRYELLRTLFEAGINEFNIYRPTECRKPLKYPVFIRSESDHEGSSDELVADPAALDAALLSYLKAGHSREDTVIEEFCDVSEDEGIFKKYSSFRIGDHIVPAHLDFAKKWMVKDRNIIEFTEEIIAQKKLYIASNPHREELMKIFELARIQYGRIDYGLKNGRIQVWEINTNPLHFSSRQYSRKLKQWYAHLHTAVLSTDMQTENKAPIINPVWQPPGRRVLSSIRRVANKNGINRETLRKIFYRKGVDKVKAV